MNTHTHTGHSVMVAAAYMQSPIASLAWDCECGVYAVPANDNLKLKADDLTPSEALFTVQRIKQKLLRENRETHSLMVSATRRKIWDELVACEHCLRWKYFR
jgi:hypothetical protein